MLFWLRCDSFPSFNYQDLAYGSINHICRYCDTSGYLLDLARGARKRGITGYKIATDTIASTREQEFLKSSMQSDMANLRLEMHELRLIGLFLRFNKVLNSPLLIFHGQVLTISRGLKNSYPWHPSNIMRPAEAPISISRYSTQHTEATSSSGV